MPTDIPKPDRDVILPTPPPSGEPDAILPGDREVDRR